MLNSFHPWTKSSIFQWLGDSEPGACCAVISCCVSHSSNLASVQWNYAGQTHMCVSVKANPLPKDLFLQSWVFKMKYLQLWPLQIMRLWLPSLSDTHYPPISRWNDCRANWRLVGGQACHQTCPKIFAWDLLQRPWASSAILNWWCLLWKNTVCLVWLQIN